MRILAFITTLLVTSCATVGHGQQSFVADNTQRANKDRPPLPDDSKANITGWVIIGTAAAIIAYDIWVASAQSKHDRATVSQVLWRESKKAPIIPLVIGVVIGHIFFPN